MRGTSNAPLILGIIGSVLMLPGLACSVCVGGIVAAGGAVADMANGGGTANTTAGGGIGIIIILFGLLPIVLGCIGGAKGKSAPGTAFILLLVSAIAALIGWILVSFTSIFHLAALILYVIGAILAKVQRME